MKETRDIWAPSFPGSADKQSVEVTNCFCVPHKEYEERVEADLQYAQDMLELNKKVTTQVKLHTALPFPRIETAKKNNKGSA